jgi:regulator of sigma E protease
MTLATIAAISYKILLVLIGINALIIVHEFGHFAVARACGVRCDKFYIWFDFWGLRFFRFKWGNTEYGLGVFPLGGYVKMLGQEDDPSALRSEMEKARQAKEGQVSQETAKEWTGVKSLEADGLIDSTEAAAMVAHLETTPPPVSSPPNTEHRTPNTDLIPSDSYLAKSVPQRMAIIVAGVVMNFLFAIVCGAGAYMFGVKDTAPMVGNVIPGSPAWQADMQVGDKITAINDKPVRAFIDLNMSMIGSGKGLKLNIDRPGVGNIEKTIVPRKRQHDLIPTIGVSPLPTLELAQEEKPAQESAKSWYTKETLDALKTPDLKLAEVDGKPVADFPEYMRAQLKKIGEPLACVFTSPNDEEKKINVEIPAVPMRELGIRFQMGPITMVRPDSDSSKQGIEPGDTILSVDGALDIDPMKLSQIVLRKQNEGKTSVELGIRKKDGTEKTFAVELSPETIIPHCAGLSMKDPLGSTALGLAWEMPPIIAAVDTSAPADLPVGARVESVEFINCVALLSGTTFCKKTEDGFLFTSIGNKVEEVDGKNVDIIGKVDMPYLLEFWLQYAAQEPPEGDAVKKFQPIETIRLVLSGEGNDPKTTWDIPVVVSKDWFDLDRGLAFQIETTTIQHDDIGEALSKQKKKMIDYSLSVFKLLGSLGSEASPKVLGGPVAIVQVAWVFVSSGFGKYLLFLCMIGANLAVINILPVPVLDGGHLVFLAYEGIFRKPPNETVLIILSYIGLALLLLLMLWAFSLDLGFVKRL